MGHLAKGRMLGRSMALAALLVGALGATAVAAGGPERPLHLRGAKLIQQGQQLQWEVHLGVGIQIRALQKQHRSLCLLIEPPHHRTVLGRVCVVPPAGKGGGPRLVYRSAKATKPGWRIINATVKRPTSSQIIATFLPAEAHIGYQPLHWQVLSSVAPPACTPTTHNPNLCANVFPAKPRTANLHSPVPVGCVPSGPSEVFSGPSNKHDIALTFDDGPWNDPPTIDFLKVLEQYHVPATFFEIGDQISTYDPGGTLERRMLSDGDMIGDHTWTHPDMTTLSSSEQTSQLLETANAIKSATHGFRTCIWRPPYGSVNSQVISLARSLGLITIQWDVDTVDWSLPGTSVIYQRAVNGAHNGAIILQHFGGGPRQETLAALPQEITTLKARGYHFVTITKMLGLKLIYK
jgi:peptidoglycan/xylan/chitin deacetylase (PgdA/CDA1 family)